MRFAGERRRLGPSPPRLRSPTSRNGARPRPGRGASSGRLTRSGPSASDSLAHGPNPPPRPGRARRAPAWPGVSPSDRRDHDPRHDPYAGHSGRPGRGRASHSRRRVVPHDHLEDPSAHPMTGACCGPDPRNGATGDGPRRRDRPTAPVGRRDGFRRVHPCRRLAGAVRGRATAGCATARATRRCAALARTSGSGLVFAPAAALAARLGSAALAPGWATSRRTGPFRLLVVVLVFGACHVGLLGERRIVPVGYVPPAMKSRDERPVAHSQLSASEGRSSEKSRRRPTLPGGYPPSTIGAGGLHYRVRDGNGCFPAAIATGNL